MRRLLAIVNVVGLTMMLFASTMLLPTVLSFVQSDGAEDAFLDGLLAAVGIGALFWFGTRRFKAELRPRDGFPLVTLVWLTLPLLAAIPLLIYFDRAGIPLSFTDAYFEAMSGLTTTGATILTGLDTLPMSINLWRATLVWVGGMGILVLAVAILPLLGVGGHQVFRAETPGPMKDDRLTPRIASTAKALYAVYVGLSGLCLVAYRIAGLSWFEAWCHMATTMGLGGFSTKDTGFAYFDSVAVEMVAMVFMLIAGINFATHFTAWRFRSLGVYRRCPETLPYLLVVLIVGALVSVGLYVSGIYVVPLEALRYGMFNTISVATTTGYANTDYTVWPLGIPLFLLVLSGFTTSAGSTGGGVKMMRVVLLAKQVRAELVTMLHPHAVSPVRVNGRIVESRVLSSVAAFVMIYALSILLLTAIMLASGMREHEAVSTVLAMVNNTGPALGQLGPMGSFATLNTFQTWVCTFAMLIGRLEFFTVLILLTPSFWRR